MLTIAKRGWTQKKLDELGFVGRGKSRHRPRNEPSLYDGPYPFIQTAEIVAADCYITEHIQTYSDKGLAQSKMWEPDTVCISIAGENTGATAILKFRACFPDSVIGFIADREKADVHFVKHALDFMKSQIRTVTKGATQDNLSVEKLLSFPILTPPLPVQQKIAGVLASYDELIENNTQRIKILEQMAQALYRQWFVRPCQSGKLPRGWEEKKVTDAVCVNPPTPVPRDTEKPHVPMDSLSTTSMLIGDYGIRTGNNGSKFRNGDTLFARITPCLENGKTAFVQFLPSDSDVAIGSTEFIVLRSQTLCPEYVYLMARSDAFRDNAIKSMSGATGRQRVQEKCFEKFTIAQPDAGKLEEFVDCVRPMFRLVHSLAQKNANLRRTRDLLLPKLISGEVDVSKLEIETGTCVA